MTYRAYFAVRDSVLAPDGRPIGAVHGYLGMVTRLVATRRPDEVVHVYDHDWRPTARTKLYAGYKADRPPEPEDLTAQFVLLRGCSRRWEPRRPTRRTGRRRTIGGLCARRRRQYFEIVSGDRDLLQLVHDPEVRLLFTVRGVSELREFDEAEVLRDLRGPRGPVCGVRDPPRRSLRRSARSPGGRREDGAGARADVPRHRRHARRRRPGPPGAGPDAWISRAPLEAA